MGAVVGVLLVARAAPAGGQSANQAEVLRSQETSVGGVVAEVIECARTGGVLSIKVRLRNTSQAPVSFSLVEGRNFDHFYVTAGGKKYFVLRDSDKTPIAAAADAFGYLKVSIPKGGAYTWWARYPAPPADQTRINYVTPIAPPFEDVPINP